MVKVNQEVDAAIGQSHAIPGNSMGNLVVNFNQVHTLVSTSTTFNVVYLAQNEANYKDLLFNKMVQQTSCQAICMCIFVVKTRRCGLPINLSINT